MAEAQKQPKDFWDKISTLSGVLAAVLVPLAIAVVGQEYSSAIKERELRLSDEDSKRQWVQLSLDILRDPNSSTGLREWAIDVVEKQGVPPFTDQLKNALKKGNEILPFGSAMAWC